MTTEAAAARERLLRQELARFIDIVVEQIQPEQIFLFGSLAAGQVHEWSDLELVVIADIDLPSTSGRSKYCAACVHRLAWMFSSSPRLNGPR